MAVWDWHAGKLITSTYTINILNDVKCQKDNKIFADYMLQFCTGGNDVVSLWKVKEDCVLESDDIKIEKVFSAETQITAVEYFYPTNVEVMVLVGMQHGEILCINTVTLQVLNRVRFSNSEILQMGYSNKKRNVVVATMDSFLHKVPLSCLFSDDDELTVKTKLNFPAMSLSLDPAN